MLYDALESTCTADKDGFIVTTTVTNGEVETSYDPETQQVETSEPVPVNPEPGYTVEGTIDHVGDRYRIVYNEQIANHDGTLTVNAAHLYLLGDIAVGDLVVGQTTCGTSATPAADVPVENTGVPPDTDEADDAQIEDETADGEPVEDDALAGDEGDDETAAPVEDGDGVPVAIVGLGLGALVVVGIVVALVLGRRPKTPAEGEDR